MKVVLEGNFGPLSGQNMRVVFGRPFWPPMMLKHESCFWRANLAPYEVIK